MHEPHERVSGTIDAGVALLSECRKIAAVPENEAAGARKMSDALVRTKKRRRPKPTPFSVMLTLER